MFYTRKYPVVSDSEGIHYLFSPVRRTRKKEEIVIPMVLNGKDVSRHIYPSVRDEAIQPCSVDLTLTKFYDLNKNPLSYPVKLQPDETILGETERSADGSHIYVLNSTICVETRSTFARRGIACLGFYNTNTKYDNYGIVLEDGGRDLKFILKNCSPNTLVLSEPFAPIQITATIGVIYPSTTMPESPLKIVKWYKPENKFPYFVNLTKDNFVNFNNDFLAYKLHLADEISCMEPVDHAIDINDDFEKYFRKIKTKDINSYKPEFCLSLSEEEIRTNRCPAYVFPFHYLDAKENLDLTWPGGIAESFYRIFSDNRYYMPVTANAGILQPSEQGISRKVVFENVTKDRDLRKYFQQGKPYALLIPVPFFDHSDNKYTRNGVHENQKTIIL